MDDVKKIIDLTVRKFEEHRIRHGDKVAILSHNTAEAVVLIRSCWDAAIVPVPISVRLPESKINKIIKSAKCKFLFIGKTLNISQKIITGKDQFILEDFISLNSECNAITLPALSYPSDITGSVLFSSGSTAKPKGIIHSIANHYYSALGAHLNIEFTVGDRWLMALPIYHISGFSLIMRACVGGGMLLCPEQNSELSSSLKSEITHISLVPSQLKTLLSSKRAIMKLQGMKAVLLGGDALPRHIIDKSIQHKIPIHTTYGSTEMASQITTTAPGARAYELYTSGKILKYRDLKIASDGEILVKGKTLFQGYIKVDHPHRYTDELGWFHTRDFGVINPQNGNLTVKGRKDSMFISGGENIFPEEIESSLGELEEILDCVVVPMENPEYGHRPVVFIKFDQNKTLTVHDIKKHLLKRIETFKIPDLFFHMPEKSTESLKTSRKSFMQQIKQKRTLKSLD